MSRLIYVTVGLSKRCCQNCIIKHSSSMFNNKVSVSRLLSQKSASIFNVTVETFIEQIVSEMNRRRMVPFVVKKGSSFFDIFTERGVLTSLVSAGRGSKVAVVREVITESIHRNLGCCISHEDA